MRLSTLEELVGAAIAKQIHDGLNIVLTTAEVFGSSGHPDLVRRANDTLWGAIEALPPLTFERELICFIANHWLGSRYPIYDERLEET